MRLVARILGLLVVAIFALQPVMACCLSGHGNPMVEQAVQPCHGDMAVETSETGNEPAGPMDCPGCPECYSAVFQAQPLADWATNVSAPAETPALLTAVRFAAFAPVVGIATKKPPGDPPARLLSPVTLKQRFLN